MPTRIVLREDAPSPVRSSRQLMLHRDEAPLGNGDSSLNVSAQTSSSSRSRIGTPREDPMRQQHRHRTSVRFRSSILRRIDENDQAEQELDTDIRSSPRLIGYLYTFTSSGVLLVSVSRFYQTRFNELTQFRALQENPEGEGDGNDFVEAFGANVLKWKLDAALVIASVGTLLSLLTFLVHFDTFMFPKLWKQVFRDGSRGERNLLLFMIVFWLGAVYVCTSSFSVGEVQANVYFTTWIAFFSTVYNYNIWRMGADLLTFEEKVGQFKRETSHNWVNSALSSLVGAFAAVEFYLNRKHTAETFDFKNRDWILGLSLTWGSFVVCIVALLGNSFITGSFDVKLCSGLKVTLDWRQFEGILAIGMVGLYGWLVVEYTGVTGLFNSPSNPYFGIWCTFFSSIFVFGTWFRETKRFIFKERQGHSDEEQRAATVTSRA